MMKLAVLLFLSVALLAGCATAPSPSSPVANVPAGTSLAAQPAQPAVVATAPGANEVKVGRYTTLVPLPAEADADPLAVVAKVHFPRPAVNTVGDAVRHLLVRTGYQLVTEDRLDPQVKAVLALRLPDSQRVLGPYRVDAMLGVLLGRPFRLVTDPASRTVSYVAQASLSDSAAARNAPAVDANVKPRAGTSVVESTSASLQQRGSR